MSGLFQIGSETEATKQYSLLLTTDYEPPEPPVDPPVDPPEGFGIHSLSANHAGIGDTITITGEAFGETRGSSFVSFGEEPVTTPTSDGGETWQPCTKNAASYISWSDEEIVVTVPSMAPGAAGYPGTYHNVRVHVDGAVSNAASFYVDPTTINPSSTDYIRWASQASAWSANAVTRTANDDTTDGVQGYDYVAPTNAWLGCNVVGHDVLFQNCTFTCMNEEIDGDYGGVLTVGQNSSPYNVTFLNCIFKENWSTNDVGDFWHGVNGVKVVSHAHDIVLSDCTFEPHSRMSFELIDWATPRVVKNMAIRNCVFEPAGNQSISWGTDGDSFSLIEGCTIKGYGNHATMYPNGSACWEANQAKYIVTRDCDLWAGVWGQINLNGDGNPSHILFDDVRVYFDSEHDYQSRHSTNGSAAMFEAEGLCYSRWKDCLFVTGDTQKTLNNFGVTTWGSGATAWGSSNHHNDFSGSKIRGYVNWNGLQVPSTIAGYFRGTTSVPLVDDNIYPEVDNG